jgi:hypothetical protein
MKTPLAWTLEMAGQNGSTIERMVTEIQAEAFANGERKGRIDGLERHRNPSVDGFSLPTVSKRLAHWLTNLNRSHNETRSAAYSNSGVLRVEAHHFRVSNIAHSEYEME